MTRRLTKFDEVANGNKDNINNDIKKKNNVDLVSDIIQGKRNKDETHVFKGYYLENDVANTIDRITDNKPRGTKSELVNEILKKYFKKEGIM